MMITQQMLDLAAQLSLSYRLSLVNRMAWQIESDEGSLPLAGDLRRILRLKAKAVDVLDGVLNGNSTSYLVHTEGG